MTSLDLTRGAARERVAPADVPRLRAAGVLVEDPRREKPRWFDGRFLAARDLVREQQYVLTREADLGRAAGSGVAAGLRVNVGATAGAAAQTLSIAAGHGVTPAGELVLLPRRLDVALADVAQAERLSARFGLGRLPVPPLRSRSGLFVLALRPVEYTANPIGAYPSSITGQRSVEDGDVVEATAVVLVPWHDDGGAAAGESPAARRGRVARQVFVAGAPAALAADVLPLAMLALQNNTVAWIDEAMVRRELGADRGDLPGLGFSPRALRLAHLLQYQDHLADAQATDDRRGYPAVTYFSALPPAGPLPPGTIDAADFTQAFFPPEIDVDFTPVPDDELPALIEDALSLQPIDLAADAATLDSTAVMVVAPVPRSEWRATVARLTTVTRAVKPAAPNLLAQRKPFEILQKLRLPRVVAVLDATNPSDAEWQRLARLPTLWFVRRRQLALRDDYTGAWQAVAGVDERVVDRGLRTRLQGLGLDRQFDALVGRASPAAAGTLTNLLAAKRFAASPALTAAAMGSLAEAARAASAPAGGGEADAAPAVLDQASVLKVAAQLAAPGAGAGLERVEQANQGQPIAAATLQRLAAGDEWRKLDASASTASKAALARLARTALGAQAAPGGAGPALRQDATPADAAASAPPAAPAVDAALPPSAASAGDAPGPAVPAAVAPAPAVVIDPADTPGHGSTVVSPAAPSPAVGAVAADAPPAVKPVVRPKPDTRVAAPSDDAAAPTAAPAESPPKPLSPKGSSRRNRR